jgi:hypothetical protein
MKCSGRGISTFKWGKEEEAFQKIKDLPAVVVMGY